MRYYLSVMDTSKLTPEQEKQRAIDSFICSMLLLLISPFSAYWSGWVVWNLYNWFVLPISGAPAISVGNCIGCFLIVGMFVFGYRKVEAVPLSTNVYKYFFGVLGKLIFMPGIFYLFGMLYHRLFMH